MHIYKNSEFTLQERAGEGLRDISPLNNYVLKITPLNIQIQLYKLWQAGFSQRLACPISTSPYHLKPGTISIAFISKLEFNILHLTTSSSSNVIYVLNCMKYFIPTNTNNNDTSERKLRCEILLYNIKCSLIFFYIVKKKLIIQMRGKLKDVIKTLNIPTIK